MIRALTAIAVSLAAVGLFAVTAYGIRQRTQEIGLRVALGAGSKQIIGVIGRRVLLQLGIGFGAGILFTMLWDRTFGSPNDMASDPVTLMIVGGIILLAAAVASFVPIRRATRLQPLAAMRHP